MSSHTDMILSKNVSLLHGHQEQAVGKVLITPSWHDWVLTPMPQLQKSIHCAGCIEGSVLTHLVHSPGWVPRYYLVRCKEGMEGYGNPSNRRARPKL